MTIFIFLLIVITTPEIVVSKREGIVIIDLYHLNITLLLSLGITSQIATMPYGAFGLSLSLEIISRPYRVFDWSLRMFGKKYRNLNTKLHINVIRQSHF